MNAISEKVAALGASKGEESGALNQVLEGNRIQRGAEVQGHDHFLRAVDAVTYNQYYLESTEANLRLLLYVVEEMGLELPAEMQTEFQSIQNVLEGMDQDAIDALVQSIDQLRLFDARDKDLAHDSSASFHPITVDIKFKPSVTLKEKSIQWRANENGDEKMVDAIDLIRARYGELGKIPGQVNRTVIAYEWLPESVVEAAQRALNISEISAATMERFRAAMGEELAVKLDVRYDIVTTPEGKEVKVVTRQAELTGDDADVNRQMGWLGDALRAEGYRLFSSDELNFGELALSKDPNALIDGLIETDLWAALRTPIRATRAALSAAFDSIPSWRRWFDSPIQTTKAAFHSALQAASAAPTRLAMDRQVDAVRRAFENDQVVVDLEDKREVLDHLTTEGDLGKISEKLDERVAA